MQASRRFVLWLMLITLIVRGEVLVAGRHRLETDLDSYRGIASQILSGNGFADPISGKPTAYRPPLYPLLLAGVGLNIWGIIGLHLLLGLGTVLLTYRLGVLLGFQSGAKWAAALISFDPLLTQYSTLPMTETLCTFLAVLVLNLMLPWHAAKRQEAGLGIVLGFCVLSRPTFLVFAGFLVLVFSGQALRERSWNRLPWVLVFGMGVILSPWMIRNAVVFGQPRVTTTHGGYTLLLGNNPVFYREVVAARWGSVWEGESLTRWQNSLETEMQNAVPKVETESERDRWMQRKGMGHINDQPEMFARACLLRFLRFWNVLPPASALEMVKSGWRRVCQFLGQPAWEPFGKVLSGIIAGLIGLFYGGMILSFVIGLLRLNREEWSIWWPLVFLIISFCAVHLVYWSNTRMRAPVMVAVVLLAVRAWCSPRPSLDE